MSIQQNVISDKTYVIDQRNALRRPIFDTYVLAKNTAVPAKVVMFDSPVSSTKGPEKTNLTRQYQLAPGQRLTMASLRLVPLGMALADIVSFMQGYTAKFFLNGTPLLNAPLEYWAGGAGVSGAAATTATTTTLASFSNGVASPAAIVDFSSNPLVIDDGDTFSLEFWGTSFTCTDTPGTGIFIRAYLDGILEGIVAGQ